MIEYNKHYITVDKRGRVTDGFSDAFREPKETDICINEKGGYQFRIFPAGEENPALHTALQGIPLYKFAGGVVVKRVAEEINADIESLPDPGPSQMDTIEAQVTYTAMMTDTLLEV